MYYTKDKVDFMLYLRDNRDKKKNVSFLLTNAFVHFFDNNQEFKLRISSTKRNYDIHFVTQYTNIDRIEFTKKDLCSDLDKFIIKTKDGITVSCMIGLLGRAYTSYVELLQDGSQKEDVVKIMKDLQEQIVQFDMVASVYGNNSIITL